MSSINELVQTSQEQFLETVRQSQKAVVDAVGAWAKTVEGTSVPTASKADGLPNAGEVVENAFDFAEKLLGAQREFTRSLIQAASPAVRKVEKFAEAQTKATTKATAAAS